MRFHHVANLVRNESVDHLVPDDPGKIRVGTVEGNDHTPLHIFGKAGHALRQKGRDDVGLGKIVGRAVDD